MIDLSISLSFTEHPNNSVMTKPRFTKHFQDILPLRKCLSIKLFIVTCALGFSLALLHRDKTNSSNFKSLSTRTSPLDFPKFLLFLNLQRRFHACVQQ